MKQKIWTIYVITCLPTGQRYVGATVKSLTGRLYRHCYAALRLKRLSPFYDAIRKHGKDAFTIEPIAKANSAEQADVIERHYVRHWKTLHPDGLNSDTGGVRGGKRCADTKARMSATRSGAGGSNAVLTAPEVIEIRALWKTGNFTQKALGKLYGVGPGAVCDIVNGKSWKNLP